MPMPQNAPCTAADYWALPPDRRAELIDGELYDMAPPNRAHQDIAFGISFALKAFINAHGGPCRVYPAPFAVNLFGDGSAYVEPDVSVICDPSKLSDRGCEGAPDLVVEVVSPSNWQMDYFTKAALYERAGVREYWIVDPRTRRTSVYLYGTPGQEGPVLAAYPFSAPVPVGIWQPGDAAGEAGGAGEGGLSIEVGALLG